jgi:hypothetical protein
VAFFAVAFFAVAFFAVAFFAVAFFAVAFFAIMVHYSPLRGRLPDYILQGHVRQEPVQRHAGAVRARRGRQSSPWALISSDELRQELPRLPEEVRAEGEP